MKRILLIFLVLLLAHSIMAQTSRVKEKQKKTQEFIVMAAGYTEKAKQKELTDAEIDLLKKDFTENDRYLSSYTTGEEKQVIFNKLFRMKCFIVYSGILLRIQHNKEVEILAQQYFNLPDDENIVDAATAKSAHQYDYGDRKNDQYEVIVAGGMQVRRADYLNVAGNFYADLIVATRRATNYSLMDSLLEKGLRYGYFRNVQGITKYTIGYAIISSYTEQSAYSSKFLEAASLITEGLQELNAEQLARYSRDSVFNHKVKEIFIRALAQDVNTNEGNIAFGKSLRFLLNDPSNSDQQKAELIKSNMDLLMKQTQYANETWLLDGSLYQSITYSISQLLLDPADKAFCNQFCNYITQYGFTITKANPRLVYDCYLYYKKSGQNKKAKNMYKSFLERNYTSQYPK